MFYSEKNADSSLGGLENVPFCLIVEMTVGQRGETTLSHIVAYSLISAHIDTTSTWLAASPNHAAQHRTVAYCIQSDTKPLMHLL